MRKMTSVASAMLLLVVGAITPTFATDYKAGDLTVVQPWARATPAGAKVGGAYLVVTNNGKTADRLTGVSISAADHVEIHEMKMDGGVMKMRPLPNGIEIKPGQTAKLNPEGNHLMLMGLKAPLKQGETIKGRLTFEKAGAVDVEFKVNSIGAMKADNAASSGAMKMDGMKMQNTDNMQKGH
ncbi:protein of unknown function DUF461 [Afipia sp. 1NLS2]|nr:protein of unknown function DUF461 [Afipia sp. 1NLS2]